MCMQCMHVCMYSFMYMCMNVRLCACKKVIENFGGYKIGGMLHRLRGMDACMDGCMYAYMYISSRNEWKRRGNAVETPWKRVETPFPHLFFEHLSLFYYGYAIQIVMMRF